MGAVRWRESRRLAAEHGAPGRETGVHCNLPRTYARRCDRRCATCSSRRKRACHFHRMAALYRRQDPYAFQLRMELGFAGIPVAGPDPSPLRDSVPGRLLTGLLGVIREDFGRAALMQWLADAPVWNSTSNRSASNELQRWEGLSREAGVVRGLDQWKERLRGLTASMAQRREGAEARGDLTDSQARGYVESIASAERLLALVEQLAQVKPPAGGSPWSAFAKWAKDAIDRYGQGKNDWPVQQQDALGRVESALEELGKLDSVEPATTLAGFQQALESRALGIHGPERRHWNGCVCGRA